MNNKSIHGSQLVLATAVAMLGASLGVTAKAAPAPTNPGQGPATATLVPKTNVAPGTRQGKFWVPGSVKQGKFKTDDAPAENRQPTVRQGKLTPKAVRQGKVKVEGAPAADQ